MVENNLPSIHSLKGEFVVAVGNAVGMEIDPEEAVGVTDSSQRAFRVTVVAPNLAHTVESVDLGSDGVDAAKRMLYMMQRCTSVESRESMPASHDDPYDVLCYIDEMLKAEEDNMWEEELERRRQDERYKTSPPEWMEDY